MTEIIGITGAGMVTAVAVIISAAIPIAATAVAATMPAMAMGVLLIVGAATTAPIASRAMTTAQRAPLLARSPVVSSAIAYAWMQAVGIVNDHAANCFRRDQV